MKPVKELAMYLVAVFLVLLSMSIPSVYRDDVPLVNTSVGMSQIFSTVVSHHLLQ